MAMMELRASLRIWSADRLSVGEREMLPAEDMTSDL